MWPRFLQCSLHAAMTFLRGVTQSPHPARAMHQVIHFLARDLVDGILNRLITAMREHGVTCLLVFVKEILPYDGEGPIAFGEFYERGVAEFLRRTPERQSIGLRLFQLFMQDG